MPGPCAIAELSCQPAILQSPFLDGDISAEGPHGDHRAAVAECGMDSPAAHAMPAITAGLLCVAADGQRTWLVLAGNRQIGIRGGGDGLAGQMYRPHWYKTLQAEGADKMILFGMK